MKARYLVLGTVLCALVLGTVNAEAAYVTRQLAVYAGSDSASALNFTPADDGSADTLSLPQLDARTVKAGNYVSPHKGTGYFTPGAYLPYGTTDIVYVVHVTTAPGFSFEAATDSIGITIQYCANPEAATPVWFSGTEVIIDPTGATPYASIVTSPFAGQRVIITWRDEVAGGNPTKTLNAFVMHRE